MEAGWDARGPPTCQDRRDTKLARGWGRTQLLVLPLCDPPLPAVGVTCLCWLHLCRRVQGLRHFTVAWPMSSAWHRLRMCTCGQDTHTHAHTWLVR